jgi:hypothetical protein
MENFSKEAVKTGSTLAAASRGHRIGTLADLGVWRRLAGRVDFLA